MTGQAPGTARGLIAWVLMLLGWIAIICDIVRLQITGLAAGGVLLIALALWLLGVFTRSFWFGTQDGPSSLDSKYEARKAMDR